ncbi:MAG: hypothetical protein DDT42_01497 [candidate division WS2 bacterium]|uniref:Uncharacterized protein n=1 Tax=Psychracetigena formicireducens TaxID=2986056 RepID=A0A9E2BHF8_PSYF1|nr:hypothetical protein [Candidatus Psychracetigena formicireducens]
MKFIDPTDLKIPRVYFTEFDSITYSQVKWIAEDVEEIKRNLERKVKLLGLIKGVVIIATSHFFESKLAQEFIKENPIVLEEGIILPALISKYKNFSDFLSAKREESKERERYLSKDKDEINTLLANSVNAVVKWDVDLTTKWFKQRLLQDLGNEKSVLRFNLSAVPLPVIGNVASCIRELESPSRGRIYDIAKNSGDKILWARLCDYTDFIYYLSGARAVNSEGVLPQENLIDFSITDLARGKTKLSDYEIFYRIFLRIIKDKTQKFFPVEILDLLTFEDIVELRETLLHSGFVEKYNKLMEKTKERVEITDTEQLILSVDELSQFENELHLIFTDTVVTEVYQMKKIDLQKRGLKVLTSLGALLTFYGIIESMIQLTVNVLSLCGFNAQISQTERRMKQNLQRIEKLADRSSFDKKPLLLKYLADISKKYSSKLIGV